MKIKTVIVTYNSLRNNWLPNCLESLTKSSLFTDVIIVDNNSSDDTCEFIKHQYPQIKLIPSTENLGFGKGNNVGIADALRNNADYIFLLNQDTTVKENTIELLVKAAIKYEKFAILSPVHLNYDGTGLEFYFEFFMRTKNTPFFLRDHILNTKKEVYETNFVNAAAWLIPAKIFDEIGGFDPIFYHYGEDDNFSQRVLFHQYKIGVVSDCYINHDSHERIRNSDYVNSPQYFKDFVKNMQANYADINKDIDKAYIYERNTLYFSLFSSLVNFRFKEMARSLKKIRLLSDTFKDIYISRRTNMSKGRHYLSV